MTDEKKIQLKTMRLNRFFYTNEYKIQDAQEGTMEFEPLAHPGPPVV